MGRHQLLSGMPEEHDSLLVMLPGSSLQRDSVMFLCDLLEIDAYSARLKLSATIPTILCSCHKNSILGNLGDKLLALDIKFMAVDKLFLNAGFRSFEVSTCHFDQGRLEFQDKEGQTRDISYDTPVLILESRYKDEELTRKTDRHFMPLSGGGGEIERASQNTRKVQTEQLIHIYIKDSSEPFSFIDRNINYSSLGKHIDHSSSWNFRKLINTIEMFFEKSTDRTMVEHAFALNRSLISERKDSEHTQKKQTKVYSNEESTNIMSRLLFCKWWLDMGWSKRIMPGDKWV